MISFKALEATYTCEGPWTLSTINFLVNALMAGNQENEHLGRTSGQDVKTELELNVSASF